MKIDLERMMASLRKVGEVGKTEGGINRTAFSRAYKIGAEVLKEEMEAAGLEVRVDTVGNLFGRRQGADESKGVIMMGSHLDTVVNGGLYDGNLGIAAALECVRALNDHNVKTEHPLEVVAFNAEEGGPLGGTFGSRAAMGNQNINLDGIDDKLKQLGLRKEDILLAKIDYPVANYTELHIEQGDKLYKSGTQIGLVEGIVGITRYQVTVRGLANHAGTTGMIGRRDSLVKACGLIEFVNAYAQKQEEPFVATVGKIENTPNSVNVIPGLTTFVVEIRDMGKERIDAFVEALRARASEVTDCEVEITPYSDKGSVLLDKEMTDAVEKACREEGFTYRRMYSGAGHDAMEMAKRVPTALIFVPSKDGISHNPGEFTDDKDIGTGTQLLLDHIIALDKNR